MLVNEVKDWFTNVWCDSCGKTIQHHPVYLPMGRPKPSSKLMGFMDPPDKFMTVCSNCLPKEAERMKKATDEGKLFPLQIWKSGRVQDAVFVLEDETMEVAKTLFSEEEK